jgi:hypothetical protein
MMTSTWSVSVAEFVNADIHGDKPVASTLNRPKSDGRTTPAAAFFMKFLLSIFGFDLKYPPQYFDLKNKAFTLADTDLLSQLIFWIANDE